MHGWIFLLFRCMDEFDVFMDQVTRQVTLQMIVTFGLQTQSHCQFILLSPLDIRYCCFQKNNFLIVANAEFFQFFFFKYTAKSGTYFCDAIESTSWRWCESKWNRTCSRRWRNGWRLVKRSGNGWRLVKRSKNGRRLIRRSKNGWRLIRRSRNGWRLMEMNFDKKFMKLSNEMKLILMLAWCTWCVNMLFYSFWFFYAKSQILHFGQRSQHFSLLSEKWNLFEMKFFIWPEIS